MGIQGQKMNKRTQQLAVNAGMYVDLYGKPWPKSMSAEECEAAYKKFAELIVRECMNAVCDPSTTYLESMTNASAMYTARERIRKHFRS